MTRTLHIEASPGSIRFMECPRCCGDMFSFDILALNDEGVKKVATVCECPGCERG